MEDISFDHPPVADANRLFRAILLPHRSLGRKGFITVMLLISGGTFIACLVYGFLGLWPVTAVFGVDLLLIYGAFYLNYRAARQYELVELDEGELKLTRVLPSGKSQSWSFIPYWARVELEEADGGNVVLSLRQQGRRLVFGAFLTAAEKREFAAALREALAGRGA